MLVFLWEFSSWEENSVEQNLTVQFVHRLRHLFHATTIVAIEDENEWQARCERIFWRIWKKQFFLLQRLSYHSKAKKKVLRFWNKKWMSKFVFENLNVTNYIYKHAKLCQKWSKACFSSIVAELNRINPILCHQIQMKDLLPPCKGQDLQNFCLPR